MSASVYAMLGCAGDGAWIVGEPRVGVGVVDVQKASLSSQTDEAHEARYGEACALGIALDVRVMLGGGVLLLLLLLLMWKGMIVRRAHLARGVVSTEDGEYEGFGGFEGLVVFLASSSSSSELATAPVTVSASPSPSR